MHIYTPVLSLYDVFPTNEILEYIHLSKVGQNLNLCMTRIWNNVRVIKLIYLHFTDISTCIWVFFYVDKRINNEIQLYRRLDYEYHCFFVYDHDHEI
jgi:hypothetical protein